jgi:hypothetical protein
MRGIYAGLMHPSLETLTDLRLVSLLSFDGEFETHKRRLAPECRCVFGTGQIGRAQGKYGFDCP